MTDEIYSQLTAPDIIVFSVYFICPMNLTFHNLLSSSYKNYPTNEEVRRKIQAAI